MITEHDVQAVRLVLEGRVKRAEMPHSYSITSILAVGITVLLAGNAHETLRATQNAYHDLLQEICVMPALIETGADEDLPSWYFKLSNLVNASRYRKFHTTKAPGGRQLELTPQPLLEDLLRENPKYRKLAEEWYKEALFYSTQNIRLSLRRRMAGE